MKGIRQAIILEDRMSPTLNRIQQQTVANAEAYQRLDRQIRQLDSVMEQLGRRGLANSQLFSGLANTTNSLIAQRNAYARGTINATTATNSLNNSLLQQNQILPSVITRFISFYGILKGIKELGTMSDTYSSSTARINAMTSSLEESQQIQEMIFESAQRSRASYTDLTRTVAKLGANAGQAFGSTQEIVAFGEILNKQFALGGATQQEMASATLQLTQALGSGVLRGQELNAVFEASPPIIKSIADYLQVDIGQIRQLAKDGKLTADVVKNAMFASANDVNEKFENMPVTFAQAWTKFSNTMQKILIPLWKGLSKVADGLDKIFTFLGEHQYILWLLGVGITAILVPLLTYNIYTTMSAIATKLLSSAMGKLFIKFALITATILIIVGVLIYLWNTNDEVAYWMLFAWDSLIIGAKTMGLAIKTVFFGILEIISGVVETIVYKIQNMAKLALTPINAILSGLQALGAPVKPIEVTFANNLHDTLSSWRNSVNKNITEDWKGLSNEIFELNQSRDERVANRKKLGLNIADGILPDYDSMISNLGDVIGNDDSGGKAVKTTTDDKLLSDEDIQLLLDVATRDYKLNYQQVTPNVTVTFGDIRETADVDNILDRVADKLEEIYDGNLEVATAYGS